MMNSTGDRIIAVELEDESGSTLRSELASTVDGADGSLLVGYYSREVINSSPTIARHPVFNLSAKLN